MKIKKAKMLKAMTVLVVALTVITVGSFRIAINTSAAETVKSTSDAPENNGVIYVEYSNVTPADYWGKKAPEYTGVDSNGVGYFFGGWYTKSGNTYAPVETEDGLIGTVVAKFVPAQTMSVKCQNWAGTTAESDNVIIRVISATDNINYSKFGFAVSKIVKNEDGTRTETIFKDYMTETVYKKFNYYDSATDTEPESYEPSQLFGTAATRFTTCTVGKIPTAHHGTIICIKPFWETLDGVRVDGLAKFAHVEDGYMGYVNVPVNLNMLTSVNGAAAGILDVKSDQNLTFIGAEKGVEYGRVFDEMEYNVLYDGTIRCVGNTIDVEDKTAMDIFINLKFLRKESDKNAPIVGYTFTVDEEEFANNAETDLQEQDVWNVIY